MSRAGFKPRPGRMDKFSLNIIGHIRPPRPFSLHSIPGFVDSHNVLPPSAPTDHNDPVSTRSPRFLGPIDEPFPNDPEYIPVAVENNKISALER